MLPIDLTGKRALVAGVADDAGYGFAIARSLAEAGAKICVGTWPPALNIFENLLRRGKIDESRKLARGGLLEFERIYPLDAAYDAMADVPEEVRANKRYTERGDFTIAGLAEALKNAFGDKPLDILVHSLANGPEVKNPLLETSRQGYLAAVSVSAYSLTGLLRKLGPMMNPGVSVVSLTYLAIRRVGPKYSGWMSFSKSGVGKENPPPAPQAGGE